METEEMQELELGERVRHYLEELAAATPLPWRSAPYIGYMDDLDIPRLGAEEYDA